MMWVRRTVAAMVTTGACFTCAGIYIAVASNTRRQRWYSDNYCLTPEHMRMPFERVIFNPKDRDDIALEGWHITQTHGGCRSKRIVVLNNPYNSDKSNLLGLAQDLWLAGYSIFLFDFRSHANTSVPQSVGYLEQQDALAALDTISLMQPDAKIAVIGASMGGAVALMTAYKHPQVVAIATDCAFGRLNDVIMGKLRNKVPSWFPQALLDIAMRFASPFTDSFYGYNIGDVNPEESAKEITLPLLIIHSEDDELIPVEHADRIFENANTPNELKKKRILANLNHIGGYFDDRKRYVGYMLEFLSMAFEQHEQSQLLEQKGSEEMLVCQKPDLVEP